MSLYHSQKQTLKRAYFCFFFYFKILFFLNQVSYQNKVNYTDKGDFLINNKFTFEIGGKNKENKQINGVSDAYLVKDNIEYSHQNTLPIWMFGFLY